MQTFMAYFTMRNLKGETELDQLKEFCPVGTIGIARAYSLDDQIVGFYNVQVRAGYVLYVCQIAVRPGHRRRGIGNILHQDLLKIAQLAKIKMLRMCVHECNPHIPWLKKWGWVATGLDKGAYGDRDGYLFERDVIL